MMVVNESTQTNNGSARGKFGERRVTEDGLTLWKKQKKAEREKKWKEQGEMRQLLGKFWPWEKPIKPRGLRNLHLEGIFSEEEFRKSKRSMDNINFGKPGCGAPRVNKSGRRSVKIHEDPVLRFQWANGMKKHVDDKVRYKISKREQEEYKQDLDKMVAEKTNRLEQERLANVEFERRQGLWPSPWGKPGPGGQLWRHPQTIGLDFLKSLGWSNKNTLKLLGEEQSKYKEQLWKNYNNFKHMRLNGRTIVKKLSPIEETKHAGYVTFKDAAENKVPKETNFELVSVLAKRKATPTKIPLISTDITRNLNSGVFEEPEYLQELCQQMKYKKKKIKENEEWERVLTNRHFQTLEGLWGRPGHGAPMKSTNRRHQLERLLYYPQLDTPTVY